MNKLERTLQQNQQNRVKIQTSIDKLKTIQSQQTSRTNASLFFHIILRQMTRKEKGLGTSFGTGLAS